jgi:hypothetical protein
MQLAQRHAKNSRDGKKTRLLGVDPATSPLRLRCTNQLGPHLLVFGRHPRAYLIRANQENSTLITHFLVCVFLS